MNIALKLAFTLCGYFAYGADTAPVLAANFPRTPKVVVCSFIVANTLLSFALPLIPVFRNLTKLAEANGVELGRRGAWLMRSATVILCGVLACAIPNFAVVMGFMGSLTLSLLTFIFPSVFYMRLYRAQLGRAATAGLSFIACMGVVGGLTGIWSTIELMRSS